MESKFEPLFQPWKIGNVEIKNRIVMVPMEGTNMIKWEAETCWSKGIEHFYRERSKAEVGLFIAGALPMISLVGGKWLYKNPKVFTNVKPLVDEIHANGSKIFFQLTAGPGRSTPLPPLMFPIMDHKVLENIVQPLAPTKWWFVDPDGGQPNVWAPDKKMHPFTKDQIKHMVYAIGQAAKLCKENGVDGVEIHAVHEGYLLDQFAMPYTNHRTDEYGGSLENRLRFACEIVQEIKKVCGQDYPVSVRYSVTSKAKGYNQGAVPGEEYVEVGRTLEESEKAIKILEEAGYDMFNCDNGTYDSWYWAHPPVYAPLNMNLKEVEHIKKFTTKPVICAGKLQPDVAAESIKAGRIDAMGVGRQLLADGEYAKKILENRLEDIRPCIACHAACLPLGNTNGNGVDFDLTNIIMGRCALNPWTLDEIKYKNTPSTNPKHIAIVGGGIGGMEVAIEACKRGHKVDLYEKSNRLGGVFNAAAAPSYKEKDRELLKWFERELKKTSTNIHMNTEIKDINELQADEIVIATGSKPRMLNIPGIEKTITAEQYLYNEKEIGNDVVIVGGGLTGCEIAYELALQGKKPCVVEMSDVLVGAKGICAANSTMLRELLQFHKVPSYLNAKCKEVKANSVIIATPQGDKEIKADTVIMSVGYTPNKPLATNKKSNVHLVGDCDQVGNLKTVIKQAYELVQKLSY